MHLCSVYITIAVTRSTSTDAMPLRLKVPWYDQAKVQETDAEFDPLTQQSFVPEDVFNGLISMNASSR
ncbi:hypothetical protein ABID99_003439 [Mucilaginibacter sp. OAE612]